MKPFRRRNKNFSIKLKLVEYVWYQVFQINTSTYKKTHLNLTRAAISSKIFIGGSRVYWTEAFANVMQKYQKFPDLCEKSATAEKKHSKSEAN